MPQALRPGTPGLRLHATGLARLLWAFQLVSAPLALRADAALETSAAKCPCTSMNVWGVLIFLILLSLGLGVCLFLSIYKLASNPDWSLARALAEEEGVDPTDPAKIRVVPSTSRLIAFVGLQAVMAVFIGVGLCLVWRLATCGDISDLEKVTPFLVSSAAIFAPYVANQVQTAISSLQQKK